ncbi:heme-dependent oxidative N-demethylase family protein [Nakamurella endophytica]|uniref:DUF3445 domain-containing protein n=1 Tax=Nakamurella endophytica TaxID=1748367 RepID=A0A917SUZ6_9ACTN|nr:DUF3445 domain-containing protein [Nakamurella endophytica]GGL99068.1 hypothetical protein GCM10011594_18830 [Nakamurella endophytica]
MTTAPRTPDTAPSYATPLAELAWPFEPGADTYRYWINVERGRRPVATAAGSWGRHVLEVDGGYPAVMAERTAILDREPRRCSALPHALPAAWEALEFGLAEIAPQRPDLFRLQRGDDGVLRWRNDLLGTRWSARTGDPLVDGAHPLAALAGQVQEDLFLLGPREDRLYVDAVAATFTGSWSSSFSLGMSFADLHSPVPRIRDSGMVDRTERFLLSLDPGDVYRRTNWSIYDSGRLDASLEASHRRDPGHAVRSATEHRYGSLRLRVELQHLVRLPATGALLFLIKTQLAAFADIVTVPQWAGQLRSVLAELPEDMAAYKGFARYRPGLLDWFDL